ncbi:RING/FYVE/PHD zinc finger superfamily protein isoform X2 [Wolffia australiana]
MAVDPLGEGSTFSVKTGEAYFRQRGRRRNRRRGRGHESRDSVIRVVIGIVILSAGESLQDMSGGGRRRGERRRYGSAVRLLGNGRVRAQRLRSEMVRREGERSLRDLPSEVRAGVCRCEEEGVGGGGSDNKRFEYGDRESLEVPRRNYVVSRARDGEGAEHGGGCLPGSARGASFCRHLAMTLTAILLVREFISVMTEESDNDVFNPFTIFVLRASGILLPVYVIMSTINSVQFSRRQQILLQHLHERNGGSTEEDFLRHHVIQIQP